MKAILFPGQGAQFKGMGKGLFEAYPQETALASEILGYPVDALCLHDSDNRLRQTAYTQPALFVVNALAYYALRDDAAAPLRVDYVAGHSLGEYNALLAAGAFDFATGVKLVKKRGELMGGAAGGGMAAVLGMPACKVTQLLREHQIDSIDLANFNTPTQFVIAGPTADIARASALFGREGVQCLPLNVSAPFHSRYMKDVQRQYARHLGQFTFQAPRLPVIANATARPYQSGDVAQLLCDQIANSVLWSDSIRYLRRQGVTEYQEIGATFLGKMVKEIVQAAH
ncbi:malonyl CoA-acyl carrier protein transacylase [Janthinobacterium sp. CG_23.3]|uniref:ACP S-malonyltransferase n=1 Tax=unclassified Janthinobacterium TaxID=2610881 RepID=UPI000347FE1D|nr:MULTISPECIES: ACP S-malonyltransferase [unclassified Janthinobacterium]MEC5160163.1 malonyl CoA-acyl carrier protein transacylase [Janthinobacterium sp. CG_S6]